MSAAELARAVEIYAAVQFAVGGLIVASHDVWVDDAVILTLIGWAQVVKALVSFCLPAVAMRGLSRVSDERAWEFQLGGTVFLALAAWLVVRLAS